jgi:cytoskeletal protein RodZ
MERHWDTASKHERSAPADEAVLAQRQNFCAYLVSARKQRSMSIHEIAGVTRIPVRSLERLESGLFEQLPADVFVRGFLRSYARCVGLDAEDTIRRYTSCGMPAAPVASPMADQLASSMATLHEGGHPSVRQVTAPLPSQAVSEDGIGTSPGWQTQPAAHAAARMSRPATSTDANRNLTETRHVSVAQAAAGAYVQQHDEDASSDDVPVRAPASVPLLDQISASISGLGAASSHDEQTSDEPPARRKRRRRRRQRREIADTASIAPVAKDAQVDSTSSTLGAFDTSRASGRGPVHGPNVESVVDAPDGISLPSIDVVGEVVGEAPRLRAESMSDTTPQLTRAATAAEHAVGRPFTTLPRARAQAARTQPVGRGRAPAVTGRPVLVIDDAHPEEAERAQEERVERSDSSWRSLLPPSLLDSDDGSHRGTLTLAVIILVIVATLTMSYLLRRPNVSGDGVTWNAAAELDEHRFG